MKILEKNCLKISESTIKSLEWKRVKEFIYPLVLQLILMEYLVTDQNNRFFFF